jgi:hypothetical protein
MPSTIEIRVQGVDAIRQLERTLANALSPERLTAKAIVIAREAGQILLTATTRAVVEAIYDSPTFPSLSGKTPSDWSESYGGNDTERSNDLLNAHVLREENAGLSQIVEVDPDYEVTTDSHSGRELVIDYALFVHDGYVQWVHGTDTGVFHEGRFWMRVAEIEAIPVIMEYIAIAFVDSVYEVLAA